MAGSAQTPDFDSVAAHAQSRGLTVERSVVNGECRSCGAEELRAYPVHSEGGWYDVVKCQRCLTSMERNVGRRLGPIRLLSDEI